MTEYEWAGDRLGIRAGIGRYVAGLTDEQLDATAEEDRDRMKRIGSFSRNSTTEDALDNLYAVARQMERLRRRDVLYFG